MKYLSFFLAVAAITVLTGCAAQQTIHSVATELSWEAREARRLDLAGQDLTTVPSYVFGLSKLEELDLSDNKLTGAIPAEIRQLRGLRKLDLSGNQMTGVPAEVGQLAQLEELDLSDNQITGLPHELANLKNLKVLDLRGNDPSAFDLEIIKKGLPATLILTDNQ